MVRLNQLSHLLILPPDLVSWISSGALSVEEVLFPSRWCIIRRGGAFSVEMVHYPSGWCLFRRGRSFSGGPSVVVLGIVMRTNTTHFKDLLILNLYRLEFRNIKMLKRFLSGHWGFKNCGEFWFFAICRIWDSPTPGPLIPICRAFIFEGLRFPERPILPYLIQIRSRGFAGVMTSKIPQSKNDEVHHFRVQLFRRYMLPKYPDYAFRRHQNQIAVCSSSSQNKSANTNSLRTSKIYRAS